MEPIGGQKQMWFCRRMKDQALPGRIHWEKKLLLISFFFPPILSGGVFRPLKFAKYLPDHGWKTTVLTVREFGYKDEDESLLQEIGDHVEIQRTRFWSYRNAKSKIKGLIEKAARKEAMSGGPYSDTSGYVEECQRKWKEVLNNLMKAFGKAVEFFLIPDEQILWVCMSLFSSLTLIRREGIPVILTTSPPNSAHLLGLFLKKVTRVKWIVDFRDPWFSHWFGRAEMNSLYFMRQKIEGCLEKLVIKNADKVLCVSKGQRDILCKAHGLAGYSKVDVVTNGYDSEDFLLEGKRENSLGTTVFCHCGYLYKGTADAFFDALEDLLGEEDLRTRLEVRFVGQVYEGYIDRMDQSSYREVYRLIGQVSHQETIRNMQSSDVLLIITGGETFGKDHIPAKIFEYMASKKRILMISRHYGDAAMILKKSGLATIIDEGDVETVKETIRMFVNSDKLEDCQFSADDGFIRCFERRELAGHLARFLDQLVVDGSPCI